MPVRSQTRETCQGSSDNVVVPIEEFKKTLDGAVRIARWVKQCLSRSIIVDECALRIVRGCCLRLLSRSFDDGLAECGMNCPVGILALDKTLNNHYKAGEPRGPAINTMFPCH
jgi:hypothetical protein